MRMTASEFPHPLSASTGLQHPTSQFNAEGTVCESRTLASKFIGAFLDASFASLILHSKEIAACCLEQGKTSRRLFRSL